jgi:hypothetical protein
LPFRIDGFASVGPLPASRSARSFTSAWMALAAVPGGW